MNLVIFSFAVFSQFVVRAWLETAFVMDSAAGVESASDASAFWNEFREICVRLIL